MFKVELAFGFCVTGKGMKKHLIIIVSGILLVATSLARAGNVYLGPAFFLQDNTTHTSNYRGLHPRISVGYAQMLEDFYLAGEVFGVPATATLADNHNNSASVRSSRTVGASILPGAMVTENVLGYARLGVVNTQFPSPNTSRAGAQVGVGLQTCLTPHWDLRLEYSYTAYKTVPTLGAVKSDQVGLGFVYKVLG
jgi:opacity protein-like surface antigen